jgi:glutamine amidotransferase/cyclase
MYKSYGACFGKFCFSCVQADRPFLGVCLGLQLLYEGGDENGGVEGLGIIPGRVGEFDRGLGLPVPHIGWNNIIQRRPSRLLHDISPEERLYFVHSFRALPSADSEDWVLATGQYGEGFVAVVSRGNVHACQFHPEKSGAHGQAIVANFLDLENILEPETLAMPSAGARSLSQLQSFVHLFCSLACWVRKVWQVREDAMAGLYILRQCALMHVHPPKPHANGQARVASF